VLHAAYEQIYFSSLMLRTYLCARLDQRRCHPERSACLERSRREGAAPGMTNLLQV
jgi:hypothetical protein